MAKRTGFITIDRQLLNSETWLAEPFTKGQAIVDLIGLANHEDNEICKRGQLLTSERTLAARWQWSRDKVRRFLRSTSLRTSIRTNDHTIHGTLITIENYDVFQLPPKGERTTYCTNERTRERTQTININNIKKISLMQTDREELEAELGAERLEGLLEDVRLWAETSGVEVGNLPARIRQFARRQDRDAATAKPRKHKKTMEEITAEALADLIPKEEQ